MAAKIIKILLLQFLCVFIVLQVGLALDGISYLSILFWSFLLFTIVYAGFLAPNRNKDIR
ncbi:hypothetical protein [Macrococcoides bohemicum]|uniref:hypothetical protein n=1 Tax=Macrococcoides bohemicum TaxID=1903056 RepID=UPI00193F1378|nr:hypothetical protein [Macrococcus bohemicus]QRN48658.1 hypothetical protein HT586_00410 [Macrococcus bohemicus]